MWTTKKPLTPVPSANWTVRDGQSIRPVPDGNLRRWTVPTRAVDGPVGPTPAGRARTEL